MVKGLLKSIFFTTQTLPYQVFPLPHLLLPDHLQALYLEYYQRGTGAIVLIMMGLIILFEMIWGDSFQRSIARLLLIIAGFWTVLPGQSSNQFYKFVVLSFPSNVYFLPVLRVPVFFLYSLLAFLFGILFITFSNQVKSQVNPQIYRLFNLACLILTLFLLLPLVSEEIWVK